MGEVWKPIQGYERLYEVSNCGNVKSIKSDKLLKQLNNGNGYLVVNLSKKGEVKKHFVHRLVATAFVEKPYDYTVVNHKDEIKTNNNADNLEWCTLVYNFQYGTTPERRAKTARGKLGKESRRCFEIICVETGELFYGTGEIQRKYGFNPSNIIACCKGKRNIANGYHWKYERS